MVRSLRLAIVVAFIGLTAVFALETWQQLSRYTAVSEANAKAVPEPYGFTKPYDWNAAIATGQRNIEIASLERELLLVTICAVAFVGVGALDRRATS